MINQILISCDLTRIKKEDGKLRPFHRIRLKKYYDLLSWQIKQATRLPVKILGWSENGFSQKRFYELANVQFLDEKSWVNIFDIKEISNELKSYYENLIKDSLVIYIEMSDTQKKLHNLLKIPYIDISVHPIRYMSDHYFLLSTNNQDIFNRLKEYELDERQYYLGAQLLKVQLDQNPFIADKNTSLLIGQTELDRSLIKGKKLYSLNNYLDQITKIAKESSILYFKPHPYVKNKELYERLSSIQNLKFTNENVYKLLACDGVDRIIGISSSVLYEAKYFNKKCMFLNKKFDMYKESFSEINYISIGNDILQPSFWEYIILGTRNIEKIKVQLDSNTIRASLNDFWSYTEFDPITRVIKKSGISFSDKKLNSKPQKNINHGFIGKLIAITDTIGLSSIGEIIRFKALNLKLEQCRSSGEREIKNIHFLTYRPEAPLGGRGGAGAVQTAIKTLIGPSLGQYPVKYSFSEKDGVWHTIKNKYFVEKRFPKIYSKKSRCFQLWATMVFVFDNAKSNNTLYITQDIPTAYALATMNRRYILVIHSQGSRLDEIDALGEYFSKVERNIINKMEDVAILNAKKVYFPALGAKEEFIKSKYKKQSILDKVKFADCPLYNTLYYIPESEVYPSIKEDDSYISFISVGTVTSSKGQDRTLDYLIKLANKNPTLKIRWFCVGKGPLLSKVRDLYESSSPDNLTVEFLEKVPYPKVQYLLKISDIYIMLHRKSVFDLATLEAMNNKCMLILSRQGGNFEFNVCNNVLFDDQDFDFVIDNIRKLQDINKKTYEEYFSNKCFINSWTENLLKDIDNIKSITKTQIKA